MTVDFLVMVDRLSLISWSRIVTAVESRALPDHKDNGWIHIYILLQEDSGWFLFVSLSSLHGDLRMISSDIETCPA